MKQFAGRAPSGWFATRTLTGHVIRGAVAFALLYFAVEQQHLHPVASLVAGLLALVAMRGCPACWTIGLLETIRRYRSGAKPMINWIFALVLSLSGARTLLAHDAPVREKVSFAAATAVDGGVTVNGELKIPAVSGARLPAVVVIHGSGGLQDG